ncbi:MFS transporter [Tundrisphaera lichenicola]|uniref:MFS transporter n=1 Tax=Tundrisphaera lichenicola TaxID=2029860 RepID=UPI003EBEC7A0
MSPEACRANSDIKLWWEWTVNRPRGLSLLHLTLFGSLYAIQGIVISYFFNFNQEYMSKAGVSEGAIGTVRSLALLPLVLRFLGGPLSDRINLLGLGHRRPFIVLGLLMQGIGLLGLSLVNPGLHLVGFGVMAVLTVLGLALYDTATDGMILDATAPEDRARLQGALVAVRFFAAMGTSVGFGYWLKQTGNGPGQGDGVIWAIVGLGLIPFFLQIVLREPPKIGIAEGFQWEALGVLIKPRSLILLAFGTLYAIVAYAVEINLSPYYHHIGFDEQDVGQLGAIRYLGRAVGAIAMGLGMRRIGRGWTLLIGVVALAGSTMGQAAVTGGISAGLAAFAFGLANGWDDALFYVLAMEASDPRMPASTCALFMSVTNLSVTGGGFFALGVSAFDGRYPPVFAIAAVLVLAALPLILPLSRTPKTPERMDSGIPT